MQLPHSFIDEIKKIIPQEEEEFLAALDQTSRVSIRLNPHKGKKLLPLCYQLVPWANEAYYLPERIPFTYDPLFHAGCYYVQEPSSMFLQQIIRQEVTTSVRYLDLCAAPGGKTTLAIDALPQGSWIVANEVVRSRAQVLAENIAKWGDAHIAVCNNTPADLSKLTHYFDVILADVPCSGEGMFRKDSGAVSEWSPLNVAKCVARQHEIIDTIWHALAPGGLFIYSTCTYNMHENEENIQYLQQAYGAQSVEIAIDDMWQITPALQGNAHCYRFFPHKTAGEGFFIAALRKPDVRQNVSRQPIKSPIKKEKKINSALTKDEQQVAQNALNWLSTEESYRLYKLRDEVIAIPNTRTEDFERLQETVNLLQCGIHLGMPKGKKIVPSQQLALSTALRQDAFPAYEITWDKALSFLRCEALQLPANCPIGYVCITYKGVNLGFVNNIGNRANNLYPTEWRIRSPHNPTQSISL